MNRVEEYSRIYLHKFEHLAELALTNENEKRERCRKINIDKYRT